MSWHHDPETGMFWQLPDPPWRRALSPEVNAAAAATFIRRRYGRPPWDVWAWSPWTWALGSVACGLSRPALRVLALLRDPESYEPPFVLRRWAGGAHGMPPGRWVPIEYVHYEAGLVGGADGGMAALDAIRARGIRLEQRTLLGSSCVEVRLP